MEYYVAQSVPQAKAMPHPRQVHTPRLLDIGRLEERRERLGDSRKRTKSSLPSPHLDRAS